MRLDVTTGLRSAAGIAASAVLLALYARGGPAWLLGFVALVPWIASLDPGRGLLATLLNAWAMTVAFVLAAFAWFAFAIADYLVLAPALALLALVVLAPLLQPQLLVFALVRRWASRRHAAAITALAGAAAWIACEWLWPKLLGDTLGHGLYPSPVLRQFAEVSGAAGLSFLLLLVNQALALAIGRRNDGRAWRSPLLVAAVVPVLLGGYGAVRLWMLAGDAGTGEPPLRIGMVQTGIVDYERLRAQLGAGEVVRRVLDAHFSRSWPLAKSGRVDALLWSETVYPTTYGNPKSEAGAEFDGEIAEFVRAAAVPLVFGSYDTDAAGEYNAAAFVEPATPLLGFYRKTRLFLGSEYLPAWMERIGGRRLLPWAGAWQPGSGARVMPLRLADGREVPVQVMICLDDVDTQLAIDGARLGAQVLLGMSNDSWFTRQPLGARLHLQVAAFRSIETRLPQARVTSNGLSAIIDRTGRILAQTRMGEAASLVGTLDVREQVNTPIRLFGNWPGPVALAALLLLAAWDLRRRWGQRLAPHQTSRTVPPPPTVTLLSPRVRLLVAALQVFARVAVLWLALAWWLDWAGQGRQLVQLRSFALLVLLPEALAWAVLRWHRARLEVNERGMALTLRGRVQALEGTAMTSLQPWALPLPAEGVTLATARPPLAIAGIDAATLARVLGLPTPGDAHAARLVRAAADRTRARRPWLQHRLLKFGLFPLLPALIAFRLHQMIAFGGAFGEALTHGWNAWFLALGLWWARWIVNLVLLAGVLRVAIEVAQALVQRLAPSRSRASRQALEALARAAYYLGIPTWLAWRILAG